MIDQSILVVATVASVLVVSRRVPVVVGVAKCVAIIIASRGGIDGVDVYIVRYSGVGVSSGCRAFHSSVSRSRCSRVTTSISVFVGSFLVHRKFNLG